MTTNDPALEKYGATWIVKNRHWHHNWPRQVLTDRPIPRRYTMAEILAAEQTAQFAELRAKWIAAQQRDAKRQRDAELARSKRERIHVERESHQQLLIEAQGVARQTFAGVGTRRAKLALNKLGKSDPLALACRLALEIEDRNISAKRYYGKFQRNNYDDKASHIVELIALFRREGWQYGKQKSDVPPARHIIYFDLPVAGQLSWHATVPPGVPEYSGEWDRQHGSGLDKLDRLARHLMPSHVKLRTPE